MLDTDTLALRPWGRLPGLDVPGRLCQITRCVVSAWTDLRCVGNKFTYQAEFMLNDDSALVIGPTSIDDRCQELRGN